MSQGYVGPFLGWLVLLILLLSGAALVAKRKPRWSSWLLPGLLLVSFLLAERLLLFGNPFAWHFYKRTLSASELDWRQSDILSIEGSKFFHSLYQDSPRYLAVGSSQTGAIYDNEAATGGEIRKFSLAGMGPLDFVLYERRIADMRPACVLLYLSEFDLARVPDLTIAKSAPSQGGNWLKLSRICSQHPGLWSDPNRTLALAALGDILPELRYGFVFKAYWSQLSGKQKAFGVSPLTQEEQTRLQARHANLNEAGLDVSLELLADFLEFCRQRGIHVVIVAGQSNPAFDDQETLRLRAIVSERLSALAASQPGVTYLEDVEELRFEAGDYQDAVHVTPAAGARFVRALKRVLSTMPVGHAF